MKHVMRIWRYRVGIWYSFLSLIICMSTYSTSSYGETKMAPLYDINDATTLRPEVYDIGTNSLISLFSVPQDNSIGTNDLNNAITIMTFQKGRIKKDQYFKNALRQVGGSGTFIPVIAPDTIGFGQIRRFVFYNFRTKRHESHSIVVSLDKTIEKIAIADAKLWRFIFEIEAHNPKSENPWDYTNYLMLMDISGKEPTLIKEMNIGKVTTWTSAFDKIFLYNIKSEQMKAFSLDFNPSHHPMEDLINQNKGKIRFTRIHPHPYLNFAILSGGRYGAIIVTWQKNKNYVPRILLEDAQQFCFSPDGKWVVYKTGGIIDTAKTYLMPVSEKYPHYLGSPILLFDKYFDEKNCGWTTNPVSFVGSYGEIYRWDLESLDFPEKGKMSFHDYVVREDLKKLAREKQQGLGK